MRPPRPDPAGRQLAAADAALQTEPQSADDDTQSTVLKTAARTAGLAAAATAAAGALATGGAAGAAIGAAAGGAAGAIMGGAAAAEEASEAGPRVEVVQAGGEGASAEARALGEALVEERADAATSCG